MNTLTIRTETADALRAVAPKLGLVASTHREIVGPGMEQMHLNPFVAAEFDAMRKAAKVSADALIFRIVRQVAK